MPIYYVPEVIEELTTRNVLTCELVSGVSVDKLTTYSQEVRNQVGHLMSYVSFNCMDYQPNFSYLNDNRK